MAFRISNIGGAIIAFFMAYAEGLLSRESGIERLEGPGLCKPRAAGGSRDRGGTPPPPKWLAGATEAWGHPPDRLKVKTERGTG